ncbi:MULTISPECIES: FAD-dependent oxidoreductase [Pantoea]|jgi:glycine/D-amino acid oxidase-like deaminating enzyme|uniref:FAD-binding oxidoreductase n=1 Tax=Pantoea eucalypti TaxID=470933 RepID=A0ABY2ZH17_9GAMM|nr:MULTISPECIES: FAD-dependent oxidoreductase [Pantoea]MDJ0473181.1 FAD-dependent oxidoreductase [Pantoea eucalypti]QGF26600.1 FAD-dependent oxidoreductase [Pantoea eucalypti]TPD95603.1 FAD-binding oxidoreductase [Pantoea vagans]TPV33614.1 FAD-binding oxidoreductase [Pantoea eucalypti]
MLAQKNIAIAGGGFFGLYLAEQLALRGCCVTVYEKSQHLMSRASYVNQARVHNGYHYPRSILTALRSRLSFPRFVNEFRDCIDDEFEKYYLIAGSLSKVTAEQFRRFCQRIGADCEEAPSSVTKMVNPALIDTIFTTTEYAFDSFKLRDVMIERLSQAGVRVITDAVVEKVWTYNDGLKLAVTISGEQDIVYADHLFNCTYSRINYLLNSSGLELIPLRHEMTEMCLVDVPDEFRKMGLTVMCGPFFSVMPFPSAQLHSFSHVRYTPHYQWRDDAGNPYEDSHAKYDEYSRQSAWGHMIRDAQRYVPALSECKYERSIWEVKTILPRSDSDDSRPILFRKNHGLKGLHCIMGGKIDNVYDVLQEIERLIELN